MNTPSDPLSADALLHEVDARLAQALDNFFQRSRSAIHDAVVGAIAGGMTPFMLTAGQTCLDWINVYPDTLSRAFADQFRRHLAHPETVAIQAGAHPATLQLVDDDHLTRLLAEEKAAARLTEALRPELMLLFSRLQTLRRQALDESDPDGAYGPISVVRALSRALDALDIDRKSGTLLLQCASAPLHDTLKQTYSALNQYLFEHGVQEHAAARTPPAPAPRRTTPDAGADVLAHLQSSATQAGAARPAHGGHAPGSGVPPESGAPALPRFTDSLARWQNLPARLSAHAPDADTLLLRQLQQDARHTDAGAFDLAVLDAMASLFEFIVADPAITPSHQSAIAQLQVPVLRAALDTPAFFSDDAHPARQLLDLLGLFSRRFPESSPAHADALAQVESACTRIAEADDAQPATFAQAHAALSAWMAAEDSRARTALAEDVANLEQIERQELGTLLALENLQDLAARHPAPESVLRRLEAAWVPHMASLYVAEAGEGPAWRAAGDTLLQLFLSLQAPHDDAARETRLQSIPHINAELRRILLAQGADTAHLKDFFSAITAAQECWIRPAMGHPEATVSTFTPRRAPREDIMSMARQVPDTPVDDGFLQQAQQLQEGDWVDFDPPYEDLETARVAWVGVHGYLLFCDSAGERRFPLDCEQLAAEIRAGRASIPEQSLTRKAMLRLKTRLQAQPE